MKNLAFLLAGLVVGICIRGAMPTELQLELGQCRFGQAADGTYHDRRLDRRLYLTPRCASIGIAGQFSKFWNDEDRSWGYRVAYMTSGAVEGRDNLAQMNDGLYDPRPCSNDAWANCHSAFGGAGRMHGISAALTKTKRINGDWSVRGEAGVQFFEHYFMGYAKPADFDGAPMVRGGYVGGTAVRWEGGGLDQKSSWTDNPLGLVGVALQYQAVYVAIRHHFLLGGRPGQSVTDHTRTDLMVGIRWKV